MRGRRLWARGPGRTPGTGRFSRRLTAATGLLAASVMVGFTLAYLVGDNGTSPSANGRPTADTPVACADASDPGVATSDDSTTTATAPDDSTSTATVRVDSTTTATAPDDSTTTATVRVDSTTTATVPDDPQPTLPERVLYVGDSIAWQTSGTLQELLPDTEVDTLIYGGTAPCDWLSAVTNYPHEVDVVLFSFMGNNLTEATGHATGEALLTRYRDDLKAICSELAPERCVAVGQPVLGPGVERTFGVDDEPTAMYQHEAQIGSWEFVDAGAAVETADGGFDPSVRQADGVHLNRFGVERFATAIAHFLVES